MTRHRNMSIPATDFRTESQVHITLLRDAKGALQENEASAEPYQFGFLWAENLCITSLSAARLRVNMVIVNRFGRQLLSFL